MIASFVALQGADSFGTSAALTEKELNKIDAIDMMDTKKLNEVQHYNYSYLFDIGKNLLRENKNYLSSKEI